MATLIWIGTASTDSQDTANWHIQGTTNNPSSLGATDTYILNEDALQECSLNHQVLGHLIVEDGYVSDGFPVKFNHATPTFIAISLAHNTITHWLQSNTIFTSTGTQPTGTPFFNQPIVLEGLLVNAGYALNTVHFQLVNGQGTSAYLPNGELGMITLSSGKWNTNTNPNDAARNTALSHSTTNKLGKLKLDRLAVGSITWEQAEVPIGTDLKHIQITSASLGSGFGLTCTNTLLDLSNAKLTLDAKNASPIPTSNDTSNFGANGNFIFKVDELVIGNGNGSGNIAKIPAAHTLECSSLEIESGVMLYGVSGTETESAAYIHCVEKPILRGTWNFEEISDGIYKTVKGASTISVRNVKSYTGHILNNLTVDGLVSAPTGLQLAPTGSNPGGVAANTLWLNSGDSNKLYHGSSEVGGGGGGGGSGDITAVNTNAPITGGATSGAVTLSLSAASASAAGSMSSTHFSKLEAIEASADVTDATNVEAAGALMDSELTDLAGVKGITISTLQVKPSEGAFANGDKTKLDSIAASANNYTHPNHSGEVTSTADGATVIADNVVDEANLKVSNSPTNGYALTAQSGASGGLTWAAMSGGGGGAAPAIEDNSGTPAFATGITKAEVLTLLNVEDGADVTDATNVAAAGAVMVGQAGSDPYNPANPGNWAGPPPNTIEEAIQRIATQLALMNGPIPP